MRIQHTITFLDNQLPAKQAARLRVHLEAAELVQSQDPFLNFVIFEDDSAWPQVEALLAEHPAIDLAWTQFSSAELAAAPWVELRPEWHHGYPMPADDFGYLEATYDLTEYCSTCGAGAIQKAPFWLRAEPRWGRRRILQLNWVFDEVFVEPALYRAVFAPLGVRSQPALHHRTKKPLDTVVQLVAEHDGADIELGDLRAEACPTCCRIKYLPPGRKQPALRRPLSGHLVRTQQIFGSGASAWRLVLASNILYRRLAESGARGLAYGAVPMKGAAQPAVIATDGASLQ